jgi:hypothetical protein
MILTQKVWEGAVMVFWASSRVVLVLLGDKGVFQFEGGMVQIDEDLSLELVE